MVRHWKQLAMGQDQKLVDPYQNYIIKRLEKYPELSADRLFDEIKARGYKGSARTLRRYVASIRPQKHREYKPFETLPGEQAQADWGHFGTIVVDGATYKLYAFVFTLCWSRVSYVEFCGTDRYGHISFLSVPCIGVHRWRPTGNRI
jgi:transposase